MSQTREALVQIENTVVLLSPQIAALAFGSITGTTAATANTVLTASADRYGWLEVVSTLDQDVYLTLGASATVAAEIALIKANTSRLYDLCAALKVIRSGQLVGAYRRSAAPTVGELVVTLV